MDCADRATSVHPLTIVMIIKVEVFSEQSHSLRVCVCVGVLPAANMDDH